MLHRVSPSLLALTLGLLLASGLSAQTSTLAAETGNNTSATGSFNSTTGNAPAANISKLPLRSLLYSGATTRIYAHFMPWFCLPADASGKCGGHVTTGYESNDATQVDRQVTDMISRGLDGAIVDWYGPHNTHHNAVTIKLMQEAESRVDGAGNPVFEFAITEDQGALKACHDNGWQSCDCWPAGSTNCTVTTQLVNDLNYAYSTFYSSPAYMRRGGRPVVFFFIDESQYTIDWSWARSNVQGNPLFVFRNSGAFNHAQSNGGFSWLDTSGDTASDPASLAYLNNFYDTAKARTDGPQVFGSAYKGFNDALAGWAPSPPRDIAQRCGQTWLDTWAEANRNYSSAVQLANVQLVTWNDYDEGTELESGVDNCLGISAAVSGSNLTWTLSGTGQDSTIDRYRVWSSPASDGQNLTLRKEVLGGDARSVPLSDLNLPVGDYKLYVQAVGKPSIRNQMSGAVSVTIGTGSCTSPGAVTITTPADGATVPAPVHVVAGESSCRTATAMQIYLDGTKVFEQQNTEAIDTSVGAGAGTHRISVKAWYGDGTNVLSAVNVTVPSDPVVVSAPASGSTVQSQVHVTATENTAASATSMQIYLDSTLVYTKPNTESIDTYIDAGCGNHKLTVKAWYGDGTNNPVSFFFDVNRANLVSTPTAGSTVTSPVHVVSTSCSNNTVTATQIYLDDVLKAETSTASLDQSIAMSAGSHCIVGKGWDSAGNSFRTTRICFTVQ